MWLGLTASGLDDEEPFLTGAVLEGDRLPSIQEPSTSLLNTLWEDVGVSLDGGGHGIHVL